MKYLVWSKDVPVKHLETGIAKTNNIFHIRRLCEFTELMIMTEGELYVHHIEDYKVTAGQVFFMPQGVLHYGTAPSTFTIHWAHFIIPDLTIADESELTDDMYSSHYVLPVQFNCVDQSDLLTLIHLLEQFLLTKTTQDVRNSLITAILEDISLKVYENINNQGIIHSRLKSIIDYIHSNLQAKITVNSLAEMFGYSEKYIFNLFKRHLNVSPRQFINNCKMEFAKSMLMNSEYTVQYIAYHLSYGNPQYFMRLFKKTFGITPTEYRNEKNNSLVLYLSSETSD